MMIAFDLDKYLEGHHQVVTRSGKRITAISHNPNAHKNPAYVLFGRIEGYKSTYSWTEEGAVIEGQQHEKDLMLEENPSKEMIIEQIKDLLDKL